MMRMRMRTNDDNYDEIFSSPVQHPHMMMMVMINTLHFLFIITILMMTKIRRRQRKGRGGSDLPTCFGIEAVALSRFDYDFDAWTFSS